MTDGKRFEENFKSSIPSSAWCYRFKDGTASWGGGDNTRFQAFNICDFMVVNEDYCYLFELKSISGTSIPFANIRDTQLKEMEDACQYPFLYPAFIFNFRKFEKTYCIRADFVIDYIRESGRKSIPFDWAVENGIELKGEKMRTNWKYDVKQMFAIIGG